MRVLAALALGVVSAVAVTSASANVYVPGQYKDGIYIRPHFLDAAGQPPRGIILLPQDTDAEAGKAKDATHESLMLEEEARGADDLPTS